jgi:hypothetical protein
VIDGKRMVYILTPTGMQMVEVQLGSSSDLYSEVVGGDLKAGDKVILNPPAQPFTGPPGGRPGGG